MDYSVAGLVGSAVALAAGLVTYVLVLPSVQKQLRTIARAETAEQHEDIEFKLGVMRRLILSVGLVACGLGGYWFGKTVGG